MRRSEVGLTVLFLMLFMTIIVGIYSIFYILKPDNIASAEKETVEMEVISARKYSDVDDFLILIPDNSIISNIFPGDDVYDIRLKHNNHIDKVEEAHIYEYCKDRIGESVNLEIEIYELSNGVYQHKIIGIADNAD